MANKVPNWREALTQIASIAGKDSATCENEALMIEEIVESISNQLLVLQPVDFSDVIGMDNHMERLSPLLIMESKSEVRMIGIWGMGGIGKTTIARCIFEQFSRPFPARSFLENVSEIYRKHGVTDLREKFLSTTLRLSENSSIKLGPREIKARFGHRRVFVVLDNVDDIKQVQALVKESVWFGPGSRIIITTRDKGLLESSGVRTVYEVKCLDIAAALQIFKKLAFEGGLPPSKHYEKLSIRATWLAQGLPAAIEAYGLFFRRMTSVKEWDDALCRFILAPDKNVMEILKTSYDGLEDADKNVFIHVACLFNGEPLQRATTLFDDGELQGCLGFKILAEKSLIEITDGGYLKMHSLVDQTARGIVRQELMQRPHGGKVLWDSYEIYKVMEPNARSATECMAIHICEMRHGLHLGKYSKYHKDALKYLKIYKHLDHIKTVLHFDSDDTNLLASRLRLLHWDSFPLTTFPCRFRPRDLVEVSLHHSNLTSFWEETLGMPNLRRLDLSGSENLGELPDLSKAVHLEELITQGCKRLKGIPESVCNLTGLKKLDVSYCDELNSYHITVRELTGRRRQIALYFSGKEMDMESMADISIGGNIHIQMLWLDGKADHLCFSSEQQRPHNKPMLLNLESPMSTERDVKAMPEYHDREWMMKWYQPVRHDQPAPEFSMRTSQAVQSAPEFHSQQKFRTTPDKLTKREQQQAPHKKPKICGVGSPVRRIWRKVKAMSRFHGHESMMQRQQQVPDSQHALGCSTRTPQIVQAQPEFHGHKSMEKAQQELQPTLEFHGFDLVAITRFNYNSGGASFLCHSLSMVPFLKELNLINLNIKAIPDDVCTLQFLEKLDWSGNDFETLPKTMNQLPRLQYASLCYCSRLKALPELVQLDTVKLSGCTNLQSLFNRSYDEQDWGRFRLLELWVDDCKNIQSISDQLRHFLKLSYLNLSSHDFETLPSSIGELSSLRTLSLSKCKKLKSIKGVPLSLKHLHAHGCDILETVSLPLNHSIKHLDLSQCFCLKQDEHLITQFLKEGLNEEDSPRFACFPGTKVPNYFDNIWAGNSYTIGLPWQSPKLLGFDGCIVVACERPFHIQFLPLSYDWDWTYERYFYLHLHHDFFHCPESSFLRAEEEEAAVTSDHLVIIRGIKNISEDSNKFGIETYLQFKSPSAEIKSTGFSLIWEDDRRDEMKTKKGEWHLHSLLSTNLKLKNPSKSFD